MRLLPHLPLLSGFAVRLYYRASRVGEPVPATGPVLLIANHPNTLLDPMCVAWAAGRPVRFLAKAPLFVHPMVGWLVRASGAIPVYRRQDDPALMDRNEATFRAVHGALAAGAAVALFPEGISHSEPSLAPLRTGAARIALGTAPLADGAFPIVPVGLVFRAKDRFRSEAHIVVGGALAWSDLAARGAEDRDAVAELTDRMDRAMRSITLNLARWEDGRVVRTAEAIWSAARGADPSPAAHVSRLTTAADVLARARASDDPRWSVLARDVSEHARMLKVLGLTAADLEREPDDGELPRWATSRLTLAGAFEAVLAAVALVLFWVPYRAIGLLAGRFAEDRESVSTYRVLGGPVVLLLWMLLLAGLAWVWRGFETALLTFFVAPVIAVAGLHAAERWRSTLGMARRWLTTRRGGPRLALLRENQRDLARRLDDALVSVPAEPARGG